MGEFTTELEALNAIWYTLRLVLFFVWAMWGYWMASYIFRSGRPDQSGSEVV